MKNLSSTLAGLAVLGMASAAAAQSPLGTFHGFYALGYGGFQFYGDNDSD